MLDLFSFLPSSTYTLPAPPSCQHTSFPPPLYHIATFWRLWHLSWEYRLPPLLYLPLPLLGVILQGSHGRLPTLIPPLSLYSESLLVLLWPAGLSHWGTCVCGVDSTVRTQQSAMSYIFKQSITLILSSHGSIILLVLFGEFLCWEASF